MYFSVTKQKKIILSEHLHLFFDYEKKKVMLSEHLHLLFGCEKKEGYPF